MQHTETSDGELLRQWAERRADHAFGMIVSRHLGFVQQAARRVCGNEALAAEAVQLTFITLARKAALVSRHPSIAGWLHVTTVMHTRNLLRQHQRETVKHERFQRHMDETPEGDPGSIWKDLEPHLDAAISALSVKDREALLLRYYRALSVKEVASTLGIATAAAQKRLDRAMERLRAKLAPDGRAPGTLLGAAMEYGLHTAPGALPASAAPAIAAKAIALAGPATALSLIAPAIILMTKKTSLIAASLLLLAAGGGAIYTATSNRSQPGRAIPPAGSAGKAEGSAAGAATGSPVDPSLFRRGDRKQEVDADLVARYGEPRTKLAGRLAANTMGLQQDILRMLDISTSVIASNATVGGQIRKSMLESNLNIGGFSLAALRLSGEQEEKAMEIGDRALDRSVRLITAANEKLAADPKPLTEYFLAGDAYRRNEISKDEYNRIAIAKDAEMGGILGKTGFRSDHSYFDDEVFVSELVEVLEPEQAAVFRKAADERAAKIQESRADPADSAVDMAKHDESVTATRKFFGNMIQMLESSKAAIESAPKPPAK
jgi:RNA polymerase sigma factor (sigma-70 family)